MNTPPRIDLPVLALVLANLLPVAGVLYMDWDVGSIVVLYWTENLIVGTYTILKMFTSERFGALLPILFFAIHYGLFCAIHGLAILDSPVGLLIALVALKTGMDIMLHNRSHQAAQQTGTAMISEARDQGAQQWK